jgi:integrase/recombinase XerD
LAKNPFDKLDAIKVEEVPTLPLTIDEFSALLTSVDVLKPIYQRRLTCFILLCRWSGLAIGDASCLKRSALGADNRLQTYRKKTGEFVHVKLPDFVADTLRSQLGPHDNYFFWNPNRKKRESMVHWFEDRLRKVYDRAEISPRGCHRLRDTFAVEFLNSGGLIEDLAMLLGHSSTATTWRHYAPWVKSRQVRLDAAVEKSLAAQGVQHPTGEAQEHRIQ